MVPIGSVSAEELLLRHDEGTALDQTERKQLNDLICEYADLFQPGGPATPMAEHRIDTGDHPPVSSPPYRLPKAKREILKREVDRMLREDIIEECESPWGAPTVMVPKKDGTYRICVDYRELNRITVADRYPMPRIDDLLHSTQKAAAITSLDLKWGYHQVPVREVDRDKTAWITPFGVYRFKRMPFGLRNSGATFQRLIDQLRKLLPLLLLLLYLDDILLLSRLFQDHLRELRALFDMLRKFQLRLNRVKCPFCCTEVRYLGHIISEEGIRPDPEKVSVIMDMPPPNTLKKLTSFLQTCSWFRRFIPNFSKVAEPLSRLTKKTVAWTWESEQEAAFKELKRPLTTEPILQQADENRPFILRTDASAVSLGACLLQGEKGEEHPVEYASRLLTSAERNYSTTEREALAVVWAVGKFRCYIEGCRTVVASDHQPLRWLMSLKTPTGRLARWALLLQPFDLDIQYVPGRANVVADMLSRIPEDDQTAGQGEPEPDADVCAIALDLPRRSAAETREEQLKDPELRLIIEAFEQDSAQEHFMRYTNRGYVMSGGVLYRYAGPNRRSAVGGAQPRADDHLERIPRHAHCRTLRRRADHQPHCGTLLLVGYGKTGGGVRAELRRVPAVQGRKLKALWTGADTSDAAAFRGTLHRPVWSPRHQP